MRVIFFVTFMNIRNYIYNLYNYIYNMCYNIYYYTFNHMNGYHDIWVFISGYHVPIPLINIKNNTDVVWIYNNYNNILTDSKNKEHIYKLSWLSANIQIYSTSNTMNEYSIDTFIETFHIKTHTIPSLHIIFMCWCAHTKNWFKHDTVTFHIFDHTGNELIIDINNDPLIVKNNRLYIK